ncbi:ester cyclase [Haladaptatus halobius]|uniref:ester cyclase n=1 Tax=Haladaptatus halobius TaxID=2884875 RepID=UPI001D0A3E86|nr:ester cyclase [Haladaptatus halobius]
MTTPEEHEERLHRLYRGVWNGENPAVADELVGSEYFIHDRAIAEELRGPELYRALTSTTREIFPDMEFTIDDAISAADTVTLRWTMTGTHEGPLFDIDPTGKRVTLTAIEINRFEDGELVETWTQSDMLGLAQQLGASIQ